MTALKEYQRLEATGLWRPDPAEQRREVVVSIGEATLTISDLQDRALTHWSLAAVTRLNPGQRPAIYSPDGDTGETLELAVGEGTVIDAIEKLRLAVERARPRPGRLRLLSGVAAALAMLALLIFWVPAALVDQTVAVVPSVKRAEIGHALAQRIERVAGRACVTAETAPVLRKLARRTGAGRLVILEEGLTASLTLPGGITVLNKSLIEDYEDPAVAAGFILAEQQRKAREDPLRSLLNAAGPITTFRLLTTGRLAQSTLDDEAARLLTSPRPPVDPERLLAAFTRAEIPSTPYAYALDVTGETVLALIEADPLSGVSTNPVLADRDWVLLQDICGG